MSNWGTIVDGVKRYDLHKGQGDVVNSTARFTAAIAGTGGGKTAIGPIWCAKQITRILQSGRDLKLQPIVGFVVAPTYDVLARATAPTFCQVFADTPFEGEYVQSRRQYLLPNGWGVVWLLSADRPGGLEGGQIDFAWIDEGGQLKYEAWIAITGRLGVRQGPALITTTPYLRNWLFYKFVKPAEQGDKTYYVRQWSSVANPAYPKDEYERARRDMSPQRFAMRYDAEFVQMSGLVYHDIERCRHKFSALPPQAQLYGGIDFGWNDPFVAINGALDPQTDILYVYRIRYKRETALERHALALCRQTEYYADPTRPDQIARLKVLGINVKANKVRDIQAGIDVVNTRIYSQKLLIHESLKPIWDEAAEYCYDKNEESQESGGEKPIGGFDHALDALRYMIVNIDRRRALKAEEELAHV